MVVAGDVPAQHANLQDRQADARPFRLQPADLGQRYMSLNVPTSSSYPLHLSYSDKQSPSKQVRRKQSARNPSTPNIDPINHPLIHQFPSALIRTSARIARNNPKRESRPDNQRAGRKSKQASRGRRTNPTYFHYFSLLGGARRDNWIYLKNRDFAASLEISPRRSISFRGSSFFSSQQYRIPSGITSYYPHTLTLTYTYIPCHPVQHTNTANASIHIT